MARVGLDQKLRKRIIDMRKGGTLSGEIYKTLHREGLDVSLPTVYYYAAKAGVAPHKKHQRRTPAEKQKGLEAIIEKVASIDQLGEDIVKQVATIGKQVKELNAQHRAELLKIRQELIKVVHQNKLLIEEGARNDY